MILWIDAQLSPALAHWLSDTFGVTAHAVRDLGLRDAKDLTIFHAAREAGAVIMSKDSDFVLLLERFGPLPPHWNVASWLLPRQSDVLWLNVVFSCW
jgi:predicted nuclease of predicted toxin-antitoxin system